MSVRKERAQTRAGINEIGRRQPERKQNQTLLEEIKIDVILARLIKERKQVTTIRNERRNILYIDATHSKRIIIDTMNNFMPINLTT